MSIDDHMQTLPCPHCQEFIVAQAELCRHCGQLIDINTAQIAASNQSRVNQACSDASFLKIAAFAMWNFLALTFIPFIPLVDWGFLITFVVVIVLIARWQLRFSKLDTQDPDYAKAVRHKNQAFFLWLAALLVAFFVRPWLAPLV